MRLRCVTAPVWQAGEQVPIRVQACPDTGCVCGVSPVIRSKYAGTFILADAGTKSQQFGTEQVWGIETN